MENTQQQQQQPLPTTTTTTLTTTTGYPHPHPHPHPQAVGVGVGVGVAVGVSGGGVSGGGGVVDQDAYNQLVQQQEQQLQMFWSYQRQEINNCSEFKNHQLPLARIKKIMKADEDVRMISAEAPILFAKACELFILELTIRSWLHAEENKRRTLQKNDIAAAITRTDIFDFLVDIVPRDDPSSRDDAASSAAAAGMIPSVPPFLGSGVPYYYPPPPAMGMYVPPPPPPQQQPWQHGVWQPGAAATGVPVDDAALFGNAAVDHANTHDAQS